MVGFQGPGMPGPFSPVPDGGLLRNRSIYPFRPVKETAAHYRRPGDEDNEKLHQKDRDSGVDTVHPGQERKEHRKGQQDRADRIRRVKMTVESSQADQQQHRQHGCRCAEQTIERTVHLSASYCCKNNEIDDRQGYADRYINLGLIGKKRGCRCRSNPQQYKTKMRPPKTAQPCADHSRSSSSPD